MFVYVDSLEGLGYGYVCGIGLSSVTITVKVTKLYCHHYRRFRWIPQLDKKKECDVLRGAISKITFQVIQRCKSPQQLLPTWTKVNQMVTPSSSIHNTELRQLGEVELYFNPITLSDTYSHNLWFCVYIL